MNNLITKLIIDRVDLVEEGANSKATIQICKRKENNQMPDNTVPTSEQAKSFWDSFKDVIRKESEANRLVVLEEENALLKQKLADSEKEKEEKSKDKSSFDETEVIKSMPVEMQAKYMDMVAKAKAAEDLIAKAKEAELETMAKAKAEELKAIPVSSEDLVSVVKSASPEVLAILEAAAKAISADVLSNGTGSDVAKGTLAGNVYEKVEKEAKELASKRGISEQAAMTEIFKEKPELYAAYLKEEGGLQ